MAAGPSVHQLPTSPYTSPGTRQPGDSFTPSSRGVYGDTSFRMAGEFAIDSSPTSTLRDSNDSVPASAIRLDAPHSFRNVFASSTSTPHRQRKIRADPSLLTCFDPADKELYELWAPKK